MKEKTSFGGKKMFSRDGINWSSRKKDLPYMEREYKKKQERIAEESPEERFWNLEEERTKDEC